MRKSSGWKILRNIAIIGVGIIGIATVASYAGLLPFVSMATAINISHICTIVALAGAATTGVSAIGSLVKGVVNGVKWMFSSNYRNQVKENKAIRKEMKTKLKEEKLLKEKGKAAEKDTSKVENVVQNEEKVAKKGKTKNKKPEKIEKIEPIPTKTEEPKKEENKHLTEVEKKLNAIISRDTPINTLNLKEAETYRSLVIARKGTKDISGEEFKKLNSIHSQLTRHINNINKLNNAQAVTTAPAVAKAQPVAANDSAAKAEPISKKSPTTKSVTTKRPKSAGGRPSTKSPSAPIGTKRKYSRK